MIVRLMELYGRPVPIALRRIRGDKKGDKEGEAHARARRLRCCQDKEDAGGGGERHARATLAQRHRAYKSC